jgi:ankyrin repeat protein
MTALDFAVREGDMDTVKELVASKADINRVTVDGWSPLLVAVQNRYYKIAAYLMDQGADPNTPNSGGWTPLYIATFNRNMDGGEYPVRLADMDHMDFIKLLLAHGADVNARAKDHTETRTNFTQQWLNEDGATPLIRAAQSGDVALMKLLLAHGADPKIRTRNNTSALEAAAGVGWVEGITYEWSPAESVEAVKMLLDLGLDPNNRDKDGRTALHGAGHKGRNEVVQLLVDHGGKLDVRDIGSRDTVNGALVGHGWLPVDYADGLVRIGVQSAIPHPETAALMRKLMKAQGMPDSPPSGQTVCVTPDVCK